MSPTTSAVVTKRKGDDDDGLWTLMKHNMARLHKKDTSAIYYSWPADRIPIEIFNEIIQHLPLSDAKNMRQVCREFSQKTTANVFHTFAAKFHPRLCWSERYSDPLLDPDSARGLFARHGHHINRFTMSLEYDENELMFPRFKYINDYITKFWGFRNRVRFPRPGERKYYKHVQLLIDAAETHEPIAATLASMPNLSEIAINLDPGWACPLGHERHPVAAKALPHLGRGIGMPTSRDRPRAMHTPHPDPRESQTAPASQFGYCHSDFTYRQKELVLEMFDATEALARSWVHSLTHVSSTDTVQSPLHFANTDVWGSLPGLDEVHLGVLPSWRELTRPGQPGYIHENWATADTATSAAFNTLRAISATKNITTLHFERICGGELAWGNQRGRSILLAPFASENRSLTDPDALVRWPECVLSLPHVTKLSLKNCWSPPHAFLHVIRKMASCSLVELKLESVSLSGPLTGEAQHGRRRLEFELLEHDWVLLDTDVPYDYSELPGRYTAPWMEHGLDEDQLPNNLVVWPGFLQPPAAQPATLLDMLSMPLILVPGPVGPDGDQSRHHLATWPEIIEQLVPGHVGAAGHEDSGTGAILERIEFKSCGYVAVDTRKIDSSRIVEDWMGLAYYYRWTHGYIRILSNPVARPALECIDRNGYGQLRYTDFLTFPASDMPGWIVPSIPENEWEILERVYGMRMGWEGVYDELTISLARTLNPSVPGEGRFTGVVLGRSEAERADGVF